MVRTITHEIEKEGQERLEHKQPIGIKKERRELVPLVVGSYLTHNPSNVTYMQIMKFNNNGRSRTSICCEHNLPLYGRS